jgi:hypothetical protein
MAVKLQSSFLRVAPAPEHISDKMSLVPFLALTLFLPTIIVIWNCILGALTPITDGAVERLIPLSQAALYMWYKGVACRRLGGRGGGFLWPGRDP